MQVGFDAFALNTHTITDSWALTALGYLFDAADAHGFKLFMSFDMSWNLIQPSDIPPFLTTYAKRASYYKVDGKPFVSSYYGGTISNDQWDTGFRQPLVAQGLTPFFVPDFDNWPGYPNGFFDTYTVVDGAFSWEVAWPAPGTSPANVSASVDQAALQEARSAGKAYMMRMFHPTRSCRGTNKKQLQHYPASSSSTWVPARTGTA
jgi:glucan endo-1,3-alpha-glucosidase